MSERVQPKIQTGKKVKLLNRHTYFPLWNSEKKYSKSDYLYRKYKSVTDKSMTKNEFKRVIHKFDEVLLKRLSSSRDGVNFSGVSIKLRLVDKMKQTENKGYYLKGINAYVFIDFKMKRRLKDVIMTKHIAMHMTKTLSDMISKSPNLSDFIVQKDEKLNIDFDYFDIFDDF